MLLRSSRSVVILSTRFKSLQSEREWTLQLKLNAAPERLVMTDVNLDGRPDYLFFLNGKPPQAILSDEKGIPVTAATGGPNAANSVSTG